MRPPGWYGAGNRVLVVADVENGRLREAVEVLLEQIDEDTQGR